ncbi:uncharacterized protein Ymh [Kribbella sp. VKM Ac-2566]|nr:uncharacterized protein Ymh [Kribbella sp. VKM Ac-2566]
MAKRIEAFRLTCAGLIATLTVGPSDPFGAVAGQSMRMLAPRYRGELPTFLRILRALDIALPSNVPSNLRNQALLYQKIAEEALGVARDAELVKRNLSPDAPTVAADRFHPHIWSAAGPLWTTGQYRVAVGVAATSLSAHIAQKASSHLADRALVQEVFAQKLAAGRPRLHLPGDPNSEGWRSRQDGLHLTAQGAFAGIRNVAAHSSEEWSEQYALEMLCVLSVVARWTDETELVRGAS